VKGVELRKRNSKERGKQEEKNKPTGTSNIPKISIRNTQRDLRKQWRQAEGTNSEIKEEHRRKEEERRGETKTDEEKKRRGETKTDEEERRHPMFKNRRREGGKEEKRREGIRFTRDKEKKEEKGEEKRRGEERRRDETYNVKGSELSSS
jgi:hypothetical protein